MKKCRTALLVILLCLASRGIARAQSLSTWISGTGQSTATGTINVNTLTTQASQEAKNAYNANGGSSVTPKLIIVMQNIGDGNGAVRTAIQSVFGTGVPIVGEHEPWADYTPYTVKKIPENQEEKSIAIMVLGGTAIENVTIATGLGNFGANTAAEAQNAGRDLAQKLTPVAGKKNLLLMMGPMHTPLNESVVTGIKSVWGATIPAHIKIIGWAGSFWGNQVYNNTQLLSNQIVGVLITGDFNWAFRGVDHWNKGWSGTSSNNSGDPAVEIPKYYDAVNAELGGLTDTYFMVIGHPERNEFPAVQNAISAKIGTKPMIGTVGGSETGQLLTSGNVVAGADHFFLAGISGRRSTQSTTTPTPASVATPIPSSQPSVNPCNADITSDGNVNISDYSALVRDFLRSPLSNPRSDITGDGAVNITDYSILVANFLKPLSCVVTPPPSTTPSPVTTGEWSQFGHNAQHTNYTSQTVTTPWKYKWQWNGAGPDGKIQSSHLSVADMVQPITGGGRVYMVAANTVYALEKATGSIVWTKGSIGTLSSTPVYLNGNLFVPSGDGKIYKLNATNGSTLGSFTGASAFNVALMTANGRLYAVSSSGVLYAINPDTLAKIWEYAGGNIGATPASYSQNKNAVIFVTRDLYVHAVDATTGLRKWRVKPTVRDYTIADAEKNLTEAENGWPVIAEQHGIVFVRYRLEWNTLWAGPGDKGTFPALNSEGRQYLVSNPKLQALFALRIDDGSTAFIPNAANGGAGDGGYLPMGTIPIVRNVNGSEVAYVLWRNRLSCEADGWCDSREDTTMGEMVLDSTSVPGYAPGDLRFVMWRDGGNYKDVQTDEMMHINGSGDTLFHNHWLSVQSYTITDRSNALGNTYINPIKTKSAPNIIWRQVYCAPDNTNCNPQIFPGGTGFSWGPSTCQFNAKTRYCQNGLYGYGDQRGYPAGFYEYHNDHSRNPDSTPFTIVSDGLVLVKTNDGAIIALENGNPLANQPKQENTLALATKYRNVLGEVTPTVIPYTKASQYVGQTVTVEGTIQSAVNRLPKAIYLGFTNPHDGNLLLRVFAQDVSSFSYDPMTLKGKKVRVTGVVSLYWPEGKDPEIVIKKPDQIEVVQ